MKDPFEEWIESKYNEPEWEEGWTRSDLSSAFTAGMIFQLNLNKGGNN